MKICDYKLIQGAKPCGYHNHAGNTVCGKCGHELKSTKV